MTNIFDNISKKNKEKMLRELEAYILHFKKNAAVLKIINSGNVIGIVEKGALKLIRNDSNGNQNIIDSFNIDDVFNYDLALLNNDYEIIATEDTCLIIIEYERIINNNSSIYFKQFTKNLLVFFITKSIEQNKRIEILTKKTIRNKLLEYFKIMSQKRGTKIIYLPISFNELADYLAVDRTAMARELKNLQNERLIKKDNKKITILY